MKKALCFLVIFIASFSLKAQMDSISVNVYLDGEVQSPFDSTQLLPLVKMDLFVDDYDFFGEVMLEVIEQNSDQLISRTKYSHDQLVSQDATTNLSVITLEIIPLFPNQQLKLNVLVKNHLKANVYFESINLDAINE